MKQFLKKKISIGTVLLILLVMITSFTVTGAAVQTIQATLASDISVVFAGEEQILKDITGEVVYPILYNGTTYLPIRAVAGLVEIAVDWDGQNRIVKLDKPVPLLSSSSATFKLPCNSWVFDKSLFPDLKYNAGITCQAGSRINAVFDLDKIYSKMMVDCYNNGDAALTIKIINEKTGVVIIEREVQSGETVTLSGVDITGINSLRIQTTSSAVILDPAVY